MYIVGTFSAVDVVAGVCRLTITGIDLDCSKLTVYADVGGQGESQYLRKF